VLVDSGSGDGGAERLAAMFPRARVLALEENRSFAWAANQGAAATTAPLLLLLNPDTCIRPGSLDLLAAFLDQHPAAAGAVPLLIGEDGLPQHRWQLRHLPSASRLAVGLPGRSAFPRPPSRPAPVAQPAAAAWLMRRRLWDSLGGLDPAYTPAWWEDVDLCARLRERVQAVGGAPEECLWVVPEAEIVHQGGSSTVHLGDVRLLEIYHRNLLRFAARHHPHAAPWIRTGLRLALVIRAMLRPARRDAYLAALRTLPRISALTKRAPPASG